MHITVGALCQRRWALLAWLAVLAFGGCGSSGTGGTPGSAAPILEKDDQGNVVEVTFRFGEVSDSDLAKLSEYAELKTVTLQESRGLTAEGLAHLGKLEKLETLKIIQVSLTDDGLAQVASAPSLRHLYLAQTGITGSGLRPFRGKQLETLDLRDRQVTSEGLAAIAELASLKNVELHCANASLGTLPSLKSLTNVTRWSSYGTPCGAQGAARLAELENVEILIPDASQFGNKDVQQLTALLMIQELDLAKAPIDDDGLLMVAQLSSLQRLLLGACPNITDAGLANLAGLDNLEYMDVMGSALNGSGLMHLVPLKSLKLVEFTAEQFTADRAIVERFKQQRPDCEVSLVQG